MHSLKLVVGFFLFLFFKSGSLSVRSIMLSPALPQPAVGSASMPAVKSSLDQMNVMRHTQCRHCDCVRMLVVVVVGLRDTLVGRVISRAGRGVPLQSRCGRLRFRRGGFAVICLSRRHR